MKQNENLFTFVKATLFSFVMVTVIFCVFGTARADVDNKTGNYVVSFTDVYVPGGGVIINLRRIYNSRSVFHGIFGLGWCSTYETQLGITAEGNIAIVECGGGSQTLYTRQGFKGSEIDGIVEKIIKYLKSKKELPSSREGKMRKRLKEQVWVRKLYAERAGIKSEVKENILYISSVGPAERVIKKKNVYYRYFQDGNMEVFNKAGLLIKVTDTKRNTLQVKYSKKGGKKFIRQIIDSMGRRTHFTYNAKGHVREIVDSSGRKASYTYDGNKLASSADTGGHKYQYNYYPNTDNIKEIVFQDKTKRQFNYDKSDRVTKLVERNGDVESYKYNIKDGGKVVDTTVVFESEGKKITNGFIFWYGTRPDGSRYVSKTRTSIAGIAEETEYSECCGKPTSIKRGNKVARFEYYPNGLLWTRLSAEGKKTEYQYHKKHNKITRVVASGLTSNFSYDKLGNLVKAHNSRKEKVQLKYDRFGRIVSMKDHRKRILGFKYNDQGKPKKITLKGVGSIVVKYGSNGEVADAVSTKGRKVGKTIKSAISNLKGILEPADFDMSF